METEKIIGIVGGVGPFAGLDLTQKIFENTIAVTDQDHLEVYMLSCSRYIGDRTEYLNNLKTHENPAIAIFNVIRKLNRIGAQIIGIPCNTAHSPLIFNMILNFIAEAKIDVELLSMVDETKKFIEQTPEKPGPIGLLCTLGTYESGIYQSAFKGDANLKLVLPCDEDKKKVHEAIYSTEFGIKAFSSPVTDRVVKMLHEVIGQLQDTDGIQSVVMGCTEIPLALRDSGIDIPLIDPTLILARSLVSKAAPHKLTIP